MNKMRRADWKSAAAKAATATINERLHSVTTVWAAARHDYLRLWDAEPADVVALRRAARRLDDMDRMRRALAAQLSSAA